MGKAWKRPGMCESAFNSTQYLTQSLNEYDADTTAEVVLFNNAVMISLVARL
jgi:hypothetical protein